eukprot:gene8726-6132_t
MAPSRIIIVRHGEREDQKNPEFAKTYPRPHDSPLTPNGELMSRKLGGFLRYQYTIRPEEVIVLSSPLVRCIQTANGIVQGLIRHSPRREKVSIPIYLEPTIMEGAFYLMHDMRNNPEVANKNELKVPKPLHYDAEYLKEEYSTYVETVKPFTLGEVKFFERHNELQEMDFKGRNQDGARALLQTPQLDGKTVIVVGHGETVKLWYEDITNTPPLDFCPPYTGFVYLRPKDASAVQLVWEAEGPVFTQEHLRNPATIFALKTEGVPLLLIRKASGTNRAHTFRRSSALLLQMFPDCSFLFVNVKMDSSDQDSDPHAMDCISPVLKLVATDIEHQADTYARQQLRCGEFVYAFGRGLTKKRCRGSDAPHTVDPSEYLCAFGKVMSQLVSESHPRYWAEVRKAFSQLTGLECRHFHLCHSHVFGGTSSLSTILLQNPLWDPLHITMLDLENNDLRSEGAAALAQYLLPGLPGLKRLHLASNGIGFDGVAALSCMDETRQAPLEVLGLTNNKCSSCPITSRNLLATAPPEGESGTLNALERSLGDILVRLVVPYARTMRRLHLNHAEVTTEAAVDLLRVLLFGVKKEKEMVSGAVTVGSFFPAWDVLYLRQNPLMDAAEGARRLGAEAVLYDAFDEAQEWLAKHDSINNTYQTIGGAYTCERNANVFSLFVFVSVAGALPCLLQPKFFAFGRAGCRHPSSSLSQHRTFLNAYLFCCLCFKPSGTMAANTLLDPPKFEIKERYSTWQKKIVRTIIVNAHSRNLQQRSIATALSIANPYDRIELIGGEYLEALSIPFPLEIVASEGEEPHITSRNTAVTVTANIKVYFENIEMTSKSKNKLEVGAAIFSGEPTFVDCKFNSVLVGAKGHVVMENCTIRKSFNGIGLSVRDEASGVCNNCTINTHSQACVEVNTRGEFTFNTCTMSNRRVDCGDVFVASGLGNRYGEREPCSLVTLFHCRLYISQEGGPMKASQKEAASFAVGDPCCVVISNGAAPILDQNRILEGEVGVLLHHAGSARLTHNLIQSQRRCGIAALLQAINKESDLEENMFGHTGLKITGDNVVDRCFIGVDIHTKAIPKGPLAGEGGESVEECCSFTSCSGGVRTYSWFNMEGVEEAKPPSSTAQSAKEDKATIVRAHGQRVSLRLLQYQLRELAHITVKTFPACLHEDFGEHVSNNATSGVKGNYFAHLLATSLDLKFSEEADKSYISPLAEFAKEISVSHTIFNHCGMCAIRFGCNSYGCIEQCTFDTNDRHAIIVSSGAYPVITGCTFTKSCRSSILVGGYANPLVIGNDMRDGGKNGIEVTTLGRGIYIANLISACNGVGVSVDEHSDPLICGNMIKRNIGGGILVDHSSCPLIAFNTLSVNSHTQIRYSRDSSPFITRNSIQSGLGMGIIATSHSRGEITRNHIISNKCGIVIEHAADPVVTFNCVEKNNDVGIYATKKGLGTITDNDVIENGTNIVIAEGADSIVRSNTVLKGGQGGIVVRKEGRGLVEKNSMRENIVTNFMIADLDSDPICVRNVMCGSSGCGVIAASGANGTVVHNKIFENGLCGIYVRTLANPVCSENLISREAVGVMVSDNGKGQFFKNKISLIFGMGFVAQRKGHPTVVENMITTCGFCGVQLASEGAGFYEKNEIVKNRFGVQVGSARPVDDLPVTSAYYSAHYELPQRRKSQMFLAGIKEGNNHMATMRDNEIVDNETGGVLLQSTVDCVLEENRICQNGSYGILGDVKYWEKNPIKMPVSAYANVLPRSSHSSHGRVGARGAYFSRNEIHHHEVMNVLFDNFVEQGVFLNENDMYDSPIGICVQNHSCLEGSQNNKIHDCLDGVQFFTGGHGTLTGNHVYNCASVGLYICNNGRPDWSDGNIIEHCHICGILSDAGGGGVVRKSIIRQCHVGVLVLCAIGTPFKPRATSSHGAQSQFHPSTTVFSENEIMEHTLHGAVLLCTRNEAPFRCMEEEDPKGAARRLGYSQSHNQHVQFYKNSIKSNRACGIYIDKFDYGDVDPKLKEHLQLSEISSRTTMEALLGTSMLGTTKEHHEDRIRCQPYLEGNNVLACSIGISVGPACHPFMKNNTVQDNIFLGMTLRAGSAAMIFGGQISGNGLAGIHLGKGAKGTVSDVTVSHNNTFMRPAGVPAAKRDFSRTALVTVLGLWETAKRRVSTTRSFVSDAKREAHIATYERLQKWLTVQRYCMTETITILRQLSSAASDGLGIATSVVPARKPENESQPDTYGFFPHNRPGPRLIYMPNGGIGVWAELETRTTLQRNTIEHNNQAGIFYGKGIRSFHLSLQRSSALDELVSTSLGLLNEWDKESKENPGCASLFPGAFFTAESIFSPALAAPSNSHSSRRRSTARSITPPRQSSTYMDPSENEFTPIKTGRLNLHTGTVMTRLTPREMRDNQRSLVVEQNKICRNAQGVHVELFHSMVAEKVDPKPKGNKGDPKQSPSSRQDQPEHLIARNNGEYVLIVRDNIIHDNTVVGVHCEHIVEWQCKDAVSCTLAFADAIELHHGDISRAFTKSKMEGGKTTPPFVSPADFPFTVVPRSVSGRRSAKISKNDFSGNRIAQGEVTSQYIIIARDNSKSLLQIDTFAVPNMSYLSSQVLYRIPSVAALFQTPAPGTFMFEENTLHRSEQGIRCYGVLCADNARIGRNYFHDLKEDAVSVLGHMAAASIGEENKFESNGVGTRVFGCLFTDQKRQAVVVDGVGSIPALIWKNVFSKHGYGSVAMLLSSANATEGTAIVKENQFVDSFTPMVVVGEDHSKNAVLGKKAEKSPIDDTERLVVAHNLFSNNVIGALICNGGTPSFFRNTFTNNSRAGLEICGQDTFPTITECVFKHNSTDKSKGKPCQQEWKTDQVNIKLEGIPLPILVSESNQYTIGSKTEVLSSGVLLGPEVQCTLKRCLFDLNDVGVDAVRSVVPSSTEKLAIFSECIFRQHHVAGVMSRFGRNARIRESALALVKGNTPKETTLFERNFFSDNAVDPNAGLGDVVSREFGAVVFRQNIFCGTVHGKEDGYAWFDSNTFLPEGNTPNPPENAFVLHNDTRIVGTKNVIGRRKTGIESRSYSTACMSENIMVQCGVGIRALPMSFSQYIGNRILDTGSNAIVAYSGEFIENQIVFSKNGIWIEDGNLSKAINAIPEHKRSESRVRAVRNRICSCEGEGILVSTSAEVARNIVQLCGIGVHVISVGAPPSDNEEEWPHVHTNTIMLNRMGVVVEDNTATLIRENDIFDNSSVGVMVQLMAHGKLQGNRISTNNEDDATSIPMDSKMKLITNTIKHRFSPVFNRTTNAVRKKEITSFMNAVTKEMDIWTESWGAFVEQQKILYHSLSSLDKTATSNAPENMTPTTFAAGSPVTLRRFSMSELRLPLPPSPHGNRERNESSLTSASGLMARLRRSSSLVNTSMTREREPSMYSSELNHRNRAARRGTAIPLLVHILTRPNGKMEAERWTQDMTQLLACPPLGDKNFSVAVTYSNEDLQQSLRSRNPSALIVLAHKSLTAPSMKSEREALSILHEKFAEKKSDSDNAAAVLLGLFPDALLEGDNKEPSGGESTTEMTCSSFSFLHQSFTYKEHISEALDAFSTALLRWESSMPPKPSTQKQRSFSEEFRPNRAFPMDFDEHRTVSTGPSSKMAESSLAESRKKKGDKKSRTPQKRKSSIRSQKSMSKGKAPPALAPAPPNRITTPLPKIRRQEKALAREAIDNAYRKKNGAGAIVLSVSGDVKLFFSFSFVSRMQIVLPTAYYFPIINAISMSVAQLIQANKVVMFSWVSCPFCVKAKEILNPLVKDMKVYECDQMPNGEELRKQIYQTYKHETVPAIFFNGEFIGGCDSIQALKASGELEKKLAIVIIIIIIIIIVFFLRRSRLGEPLLEGTMSVHEIVKKNKVVLFAVSTCPYCVEAKKILRPMATNLQVYNCDLLSDGQKFRDQIREKYNHRTVPAIFIKGQLVGGLDKLLELQNSGKLEKLLS